MKKSRFTEHQIISIIKEREAGLKVPDICRQYRISQGTFFTNGNLLKKECNKAVLRDDASNDIPLFSYLGRANVNNHGSLALTEHRLY
jgi:hypothetical protein